MSLFSQLLSRQHSPRSHFTGPLWPVFEGLQCHYNDEVVFHGGMTEAPVPVFVCKFSPDGLYGNLLAAGDEEGSVRLMDTRRLASNSLIKEFEAHRNAVFDISWFPGATKLLSGSGDATVRLWDVVDGAMLTEFKAHAASVKCIDVNMDEPSMFVSGGRDGSIHVWDTRCAKQGSRHRPVNSVSAAHKKPEDSAQSAKRKQQRGRRSVGLPPTSTGDTKYSVTAVLFHGNQKIASCGTADGVVKLWDLRRTYTNSQLEPPPAWFTFEPVTEAGRQYSFTSLVSGPYQSSLFASCTDNMCYMYNSAGLSKLPVRVFSGHQNSSFYVKSCVSPDGHYLLSGSSCRNAFIWQIDHPEVPPLMLTGHTREVTAVAWCPTDLSKMVTCSDDNDLRLWRVNRGKKAPGEITGRSQPYVGKGHLKGVELLKRHYKELSSKATQLRTPLHSVQQKSTIKSTPKSKSSNNVTNFSRYNQHNSQECSGFRLTPDTCTLLSSKQLTDRQGSGAVNTVLPSRGWSEETSSEEQDCRNDDRKLNMSCGDAPVSILSNLKELHKQNSKMDIEPLQQKSSYTGNSFTPLTAAAVTEISELNSSKERSTEVTPDRIALSCGSTTKRRLKLEESTSCRPQIKRRRTMDSSSGRKKSAAKLGSALQRENSGQRTMQSYFRPA